MRTALIVGSVVVNEADGMWEVSYGQYGCGKNPTKKDSAREVANAAEFCGFLHNPTG